MIKMKNNTLLDKQVDANAACGSVYELYQTSSLARW